MLSITRFSSWLEYRNEFIRDGGDLDVFLGGDTGTDETTEAELLVTKGVYDT